MPTVKGVDRGHAHFWDLKIGVREWRAIAPLLTKAFNKLE
jgi:hypothetical protein